MGSHNDNDTIQEWDLGKRRSQCRTGKSSSDKRKGKDIQEWNLDRRSQTGRRKSSVVKTVYIGGTGFIQKKKRKKGTVYNNGQRSIRYNKRRKRQQRKFAKVILLLIAGICVLTVIISAVGKLQSKQRSDEDISEKIQNVGSTTGSSESDSASTDDATTGESGAEAAVYSASETPATSPTVSSVISTHAILVDCDNDTILSERSCKEKIYPASMTKVLTVLVAAESISQDQLDDTYTMDIESTDYSFSNDCSNVGFEVGENVTVKDLFYGTILCSGADAACGLAKYCGGTQEKFMEMMNAKIDELGLSSSAHFTNCVGVYNDDHYCTVYDMAIIMEAAMNNDICREVLSARKYTTSSTPEHPDGIEISNWFLRRIEDKDSGVTILGGKTGFVVQSGNCAVSYAEDSQGHGYVCATNGSSSAWRCIYDHVAIYDAAFLTI